MADRLDYNNIAGAGSLYPGGLTDLLNGIVTDLGFQE